MSVQLMVEAERLPLCLQRLAGRYLKADFFKLCLDLLHQSHVSAVDKVLPTPLLQQQTDHVKAQQQDFISGVFFVSFIRQTLLPPTFLNAL